jgi:hypothetical protein
VPLFDPNAFASPVSEHDHSAFIEEIAARVVARRMALPAILFLESVKPLNRLAGQSLLVLAPMFALFVSQDAMHRFSDLLRDRKNVEALIEAIQRHDDARRNAAS